MIRAKALLLLAALAAASFATYRLVGRRLPGPNLLFNGWGLTPAGQASSVGDMPLKLLRSPDGKQIVLTSIGFSGAQLQTLDASSHRAIQTLELGRVWNGLAFSQDGKTLYVGGGGAATVTAYRYDAGRLQKSTSCSFAKDAFVSGIAVQPGSGKVFVCDEARASVAILDPATLVPTASISVGENPHSCVFGEDPRYLYVSNWGSKTVSVIDTQKGVKLRDLRVGIRPNDMALAPDGRLFVACAGDNTVHTIQTRFPEGGVGGPTRATRPPEGVREILNTALEPTNLEGSSPVGVSVTPDGRNLYVCNADNNDLMVADISDPKATHILGFIPTGWYPTAILAGNDEILYSVGKGPHSRANYPAKGKDPEKGRQGQAYDYTGNCFEGLLTSLSKPNAQELERFTEQVKANTPFKIANVRRTALRSGSIVPDEVGKPSPIQHVLYVVMENRTYDQVFGDLKEGNGDPFLCMYGEKVTPNRHRLAREYTLLDNCYCNGEVSYDGHSWCDAAIATDEMQRQWTSGYSGHGNITNAEELQAPAAGYIWDSARKSGLSVKTYGEGDSSYNGGHAVPIDCRGTWSGERDKDRVDGWISDLRAAEKTGKLANFMIMSLGEDHTAGTEPGAYTPEACVASNDQAIGKIVAAASRSKFWKSMAIFFVEDDAQDGPDHVDAHRTFALVVSPWVKRHAVDSTMYSQVSMVRTIELLLGLPPMTQYDAAAIPMFGSFGRQAQLAPYDIAPALVDLDAKNSASAIGAQESLAMDFSEYDKAPADALNRILWAEAKGPGVPYPAVRRSYGREVDPD